MILYSPCPTIRISNALQQGGQRTVDVILQVLLPACERLHAMLQLGVLWVRTAGEARERGERGTAW